MPDFDTFFAYRLPRPPAIVDSSWPHLDPQWITEGEPDLQAAWRVARRAFRALGLRCDDCSIDARYTDTPEGPFVCVEAPGDATYLFAPCYVSGWAVGAEHLAGSKPVPPTVSRCGWLEVRSLGTLETLRSGPQPAPGSLEPAPVWAHVAAVVFVVGVALAAVLLFG